MEYSDVLPNLPTSRMWTNITGYFTSTQANVARGSFSNHVPLAREILGTQTEIIDEEGDSELEKHLSYREMVVYPQEGSQFCKLHWSSE